MRVASGVTFLLALLLAFFTMPLWIMPFEERPPHGYHPIYAWFLTALVLMFVLLGLWLRKMAAREAQPTTGASGAADEGA